MNKCTWDHYRWIDKQTYSKKIVRWTRRTLVLNHFLSRPWQQANKTRDDKALTKEKKDWSTGLVKNQKHHLHPRAKEVYHIYCSHGMVGMKWLWEIWYLGKRIDSGWAAGRTHDDVYQCRSYPTKTWASSSVVWYSIVPLIAGGSTAMINYNFKERRARELHYLTFASWAGATRLLALLITLSPTRPRH